MPFGDASAVQVAKNNTSCAFVGPYVCYFRLKQSFLIL